MNKWTISAAAILCASTAFAGGIQRSPQSITDIYEAGDFFKLNFAMIKPEVSGEHPVFGDLDNGQQDYNTFSGSVKKDFGNMSLALIMDSPWGADVHYDPSTAPGSIMGETIAEFNSTAITLVGKYNMNKNISFIGGVVGDKIDANATLSGGGYKIDVEDSTNFGYLVGAAYQIPELALRLDVTYRSKIEHKAIKVNEFALGRAATPSEMDLTMPESVNVNFQTGITKSTLLMAGVRWVKWSDFEIAPKVFGALNGGDALVGGYEDTTTYKIGLGQKINDQLSVLGSFAMEKSRGKDSASILSPTDGYKTISLGAKYTVMDGLDVSGGVSYAMIGDTKDAAFQGDWKDNNAMAFGLTIKKSF